MQLLTSHVRCSARSGLRLAAVALCFVLAACALEKKQTATETVAPSEIQQMYTTVLDHVHKMYLDEIPVGQLAMEGLAGLQKLEPDASVQRGNGRVTLLVNGTTVGDTEEPSRNDASVWATVMDDLVTAGRKASTRLADAGTEKIYRVTINSLLSDLDRYSRYAGMAAGRRNRETREGFGGIGVSVLKNTDGLRVERVTLDLPAFRAGVQSNDIFIAVDGTPLRGLSLRRGVQLLRGPMGKPVQITVQRESRPDPFVLTISRTRIIPTTVHYESRNQFAYLRITGFNQDTAAELRTGVERATREFGDALTGLVIDLRGNPGGLLDQAITAADLFLKDGRISTTRGRHPDSLQLFDASANEIAHGVPMVLVVNGASASASEVLAAALQDQGRAVVVGSSSFGKGTVQTVIRLPNDGELILTWARLLAPSGYVLNKLGVLPTLCTSNREDADNTLKHAFANNTPHRQIAARRTADGSSQGTITKLCPWQPHKGDDIDIAVARRLLERPALYKHALRLSAPAAGG
ncbi:MAG: PDZ domain-containing protein [Alphaproteobacteria bacterium]|nr:PDZ domain-containing protein [Alphaproteobacteria bacterium]